ncbi:MAG: hypothetical protein DDT21_02489 [Syntrophomonadaceae bacterium]|nr:hypothetical protein [Bacillota bacterium]
MGIISLLIGIIAIFIMVLALIPLLGWINWFNLPLAATGWIVGLVALIKGKSTLVAIIGLMLCSIALLIGTARLIAGGGIL